MPSYVRPVVADQVFRDAAGGVIAYGDRWGDGSPPEDSYSVTDHPERFAPLHPVADALVDHLVATYDVEVLDDVATAGDLLRPPDDAVRSVRLSPRAADAASLTVVWTLDPAVVVHAGLLHDFGFPACACDACDETWQTQATELELHVTAVVAGRFGERVTRGPRPWVHYAMADDEGSVSSGGVVATGVPAARRRAARARLRTLAGPWAPWPVRAT
ncbi:DUF6226 family protein [Georgenia sunbinii]|uniref:DUF6226 family protein n=1 Tax=Georgenia sunbinii TaxID=3117728 RepID=UPI002F26375A